MGAPLAASICRVLSKHKFDTQPQLGVKNRHCLII
jgi:hypothetical protein